MFPRNLRALLNCQMGWRTHTHSIISMQHDMSQLLYMVQSRHLHLHRFPSLDCPKVLPPIVHLGPLKMWYYTQQKTFKIGQHDDNSMGLGGSSSKFSGQPIWVAWTLKPPCVAPSGNPSHGSHGCRGGHGAFAEHLAARVHHGWPGSGGTIRDPADWRSPPMGCHKSKLSKNMMRNDDWWWPMDF